MNSALVILGRSLKTAVVIMRIRVIMILIKR